MKFINIFFRALPRFALSAIVTLVLGSGVSCFGEYAMNDLTVSTLYSVAGIVFSIGMGIIVSFGVDGVKNRNFISLMRARIDRIRDAFIFEYAAVTILYIVYGQYPEKDFIVHQVGDEFHISLNMSVFAVVGFSFSMAYFVYNFIQVQKLKRHIVDEFLK